MRESTEILGRDLVPESIRANPIVKGTRVDALMVRRVYQVCHWWMAGTTLLALHPTTVAAQAVVSPTIGTTLGAAVGRLNLEPKLSVGATAGWLGPAFIGFEAEINHIADQITLQDPSQFVLGTQISRDSRLTTVLANVVLHTPRSNGMPSFRPYVSGGFGLASTNVVGRPSI